MEADHFLPQALSGVATFLHSKRVKFVSQQHRGECPRESILISSHLLAQKKGTRLRGPLPPFCRNKRKKTKQKQKKALKGTNSDQSRSWMHCQKADKDLLESMDGSPSFNSWKQLLKERLSSSCCMLSLISSFLVSCWRPAVHKNRSTNVY